MSLSTTWIVVLMLIVGTLLIQQALCDHIPCKDDANYLCCNGRPQRKKYGDKTACCGQLAYSPDRETCCEGNIRQGYGKNNENGKCCGKEVYDVRCYSCKSGKVESSFDQRTDICCDGQVKPLRGDLTCCCGTETFNPQTKMCCGGKIVDKPSTVVKECCNCGFSPSDLVFVIDSSESVGLPNFKKMLEFVKSLLQDVDIDNDIVRVGIVTYRHNVTTEFLLDQYQTKKDMFAGIDAIRYIRGSTNTGWGIQEMRERLFSPDHGDRPHVPNTAFIITDGDSDDPDMTAEQARIAREAGTELFAIGIKLQDDEELRKIASAPIDQHVFTIENFEKFDELRERIFKSVCTGQPIKKVVEPCGQTVYDPSKEICCDGSPQPRFGNNTVCCAKKSMDKEKQICCNNNVQEKVAGENTKCCASISYDPEKNLCCDGKPSLKLTKNSNQCCKQFAFDPNLEICCGGFVHKGFGNVEQDTGCCEGMAFDKRCDKCEKGVVRPNYDIDCQVCCDGVIQNMTTDFACCCGKEMFDPAVKICCEGKLRNREKNDKGTCCECGSAIVDLAVVLDSSESVGLENWEKVKTFLVEMVKTLEVDSGKTRVGLDVYRHNVSLEFYLDTYPRSAEMESHIGSLKYIRGSTNTGGGLQVMCDQIFSKEHGDRPNVPNVGMVFTDGDSDDPEMTKTAAKRAREKGIHMIAVGIALNDLQELHNIASEPTEANVYSVDNFDQLQKLKANLFSLLKDICPQKPMENKCREPCGQTVYDPSKEICCDGSPQPLFGNNTVCCAKKSMDKEKQICCNNNVQERVAGENTKCCASISYDPEKNLCCDGKPSLKLTKNSNQCCKQFAFDPSLEICCGGFVHKGFGNVEQDTGCCEGMAFDKRCDKCEKGVVRPNYDIDCQVCCDGVIQNMTTDFACCCGKEMFDPTVKICCEGKLRNREKNDKGTCCECGSAIVDLAVVLDSSESVGLENWEKVKTFLVEMVKTLEVDSGKTRVGLDVYRHNVSLEFYLDTYPRSADMESHIKGLKYIRGSTNTGAGLQAMCEVIFSKEHGDRPNVPNVGMVFTDGDSDDPEMTKTAAKRAREKGIHMIAVGIALNDLQELHNIASEPTEANVYSVDNFDQLQKLNANLFSLLTDICPQERRENKCREPCGETFYDPRSEVCCNGNPQPQINGNKTVCCNKLVYDPKKSICCEGKVNDRKAGESTKCCNDVAYDPDKELCCDGTKVVVKRGTTYTQCCGFHSYDPVKELCCEGVINKNYGQKGEFGACCGPLSYDTRCYKCINGKIVPLFDCVYDICCDGKIQPLVAKMTCCCGDKAFDAREGICCKGQLKSRAFEDNTTCCECAASVADIVIVADSSTSVGETHWKNMINFLSNIVARAGIDSGDINIGWVTFRDFAVVEFYLNSYDTEKAIVDRIRSMPYIEGKNNSGTTNTGEGLQFAREKVFDPKKGDRQTAPNVILVVTDGRSNDPDMTLIEANKAKKAGIHIFSLGIGLQDDTELLAMASQPAKENTMSVNDFSGLANLDNVLFEDLAKGFCGQDPQERCKVPCGDAMIDHTREICCDRNPQARVAGNKTECCGKISYDPDCYICCRDEILASRFAGESTECCCDKVYDKNKEICCGNQILPRVAGNETKCCHNASYDPLTHVCCNYIIREAFGPEFTGCCGSVSYDNRCYDCKNEQVVPEYDPDKELCCEGKIGMFKYGRESCCCADNQFNSTTHLCCEKNLIQRPNGVELTCCGKEGYDPKKQICCDYKVDKLRAGLETDCCGQMSFDPSKHFCCNGKLNVKRDNEADCCCGQNVFNVKTQVCCHGSVQPLFQKGDRQSTSCCDRTSFDPSKQICCDGKVSNLNAKGNTLCCGKEAYDPEKNVCEDGKLSRAGKCLGVRYNMDKFLCCGGVLREIISSNYTRCCYDQTYDIRQNICCCSGNLEPAWAGINTQCCYGHSYDSRRAICCEGAIVRKRISSADCCCGRLSYDSNREVCCGGVIQSKCVGKSTRCCGTQAYDPGYKICCDGVIHDRTYGLDTYCCGKEIYTSTMAVCCGDRIGYRKIIMFEW